MRRFVVAAVIALASLPAVGLHAWWAGVGGASAATCPTAQAPVTVAATPTTPSYTLTRGCVQSFDGTAIVYDLFEPLDASAVHKVYAVLEGPGWAGGGGYKATCPASDWGASSDMPPVLAADYAYLTWDPRGFGESGGTVEVDDPQYEGRDVSALIDQALTGRPEIAVDTVAGDSTYAQPAVGMFGGSYGGGIQLAAAPFDPRIKAIVPQWAWNDLDESLFPGGVPRQSWFEYLIAAGIGVSAASHYSTLESCDRVAGQQATPIYDPSLYRAWAQVTADGYPDAQTVSWFRQRSMVSFGAGAGGTVPRVPTLLLQGLPDTLFNLNQAWANYQMIKAADPGVPLKLIGYCGGHSGCQYAQSAPSGYAAKVNDGDFVYQQIVHWFDVYLRHDPGATDRLPDVLMQDQTGLWHPLTTFPTAASPGPAAYVTSHVSGTLVSTGVPTDPNNPIAVPPEQYPTPSNRNDPGTLTVPVLSAPATGNGLIVAGEPRVDLNVTVTGSSSNLLFKLVDQARDVTCTAEPCWSAQSAAVDGQVAAVRVDNLDLADAASNPNLPPQPQHVSLDLGGVYYKLPAGDTLELQISSASTPFSSNRGAALTTLDGTASVPSMPVVAEDQPIIRLRGPSSGSVDQPATFTASLSTADGQPLANEPIDFTFNNHDLGTALTDTNGIATTTMTLTGPARQVTLTAAFTGDDHEFPTSVSTPFSVEEAATDIALQVTRSKGLTTASAMLTETGTAQRISGQTIEFSVEGKAVGTATTDAHGVATYAFGRTPQPGDRVTASYAGDGDYLGSSSTATVPAR